MRICISLLCLIIAMPAWAQVPYSKDSLAFVGVNVIPMTSETVLENQTVLIKNGRIEKIGDAGSFKIPRKAERSDAQGKYLMPGLMDLHAHFFAGRKLLIDYANMEIAISR